MLDPTLLEILCCPETRQELTEATPEQVRAINAAIQSGGIHNRAGHAVTEPIDSALIRMDRQIFYPVRDGIPVLLVEEAIPVPSALS